MEAGCLLKGAIATEFKTGTRRDRVAAACRHRNLPIKGYIQCDNYPEFTTHL